jgi:pimeloyl-ACP methyl ester carboxylesterase
VSGASFWQDLPVPTTRAEERRYLAKTIALAQRCGAQNGELLAHISVADTARDLDHLRRLVGDRQLSYFGESYGTLIGQTYANMFPRRVRAMALDGLPDPALWPVATVVLEAAIQGDGSGIEDIARGAISDQARMLLQEQGVALVCADSPARHPASAWPRVVDRLEAVSRIGGPVVGWTNAPCASWPTPSADRYTGPWNATTKHPILLIGTRFDPNTPFRNARRAERRLGNAVLLTHDGYGHLSRRDPSTCVVQATGSYLVGLTTPPRGTICPADHPPFDPAFGQPPPNRPHRQVRLQIPPGGMVGRGEHFRVELAGG